MESDPNPGVQPKSSDDAFLREYHRELWSSIRHKEQNIMGFLGFYSAVIALLVGIGTRATNIGLVTFLVIFLSYWGIAIVADANWWWARNMRLIVNVQKILFGSAFSSILPKQYLDTPVRMTRIYRIHLNSLALVITVAFIAYLFTAPLKNSQTDTELLLYFILNTFGVIFGLFIVWGRQNKDRRRHFELHKEVPGISIILGDGSALRDLSFYVPVEYLVIRDETSSNLNRVATVALAFLLAVSQILILINFFEIDEKIKVFEASFMVFVIILIARLFQYLASKRISHILTKDEKEWSGKGIEKGWPDNKEDKKALKLLNISMFLYRFLAKLILYDLLISFLFLAFLYIGALVPIMSGWINK
jgi:hypothetical protein